MIWEIIVLIKNFIFGENAGTETANARNRNDSRARIRKYRTPCINKWNSGEQYYQYIRNHFGIKKYDVCNQCYEHMGDYRHHYRSKMAVSNGSCDCGDLSLTHESKVFCHQHKECNQNLMHHTTHQENAGTETAALAETRSGKLNASCSNRWNSGGQYYEYVKSYFGITRYDVCKECYERMGDYRHHYRSKMAVSSGSCDCGDVSVTHESKVFCHQHKHCNQNSTDGENNQRTDAQRIRKFRSPCVITWNRGEQFYHCETCSSAKKVTICAECFGHSQHSLHKHRQCKSEFNGSCDCGDISAMRWQSFCVQHKHCDQSLINYKTTFGSGKQITKMKTLLDVKYGEAKRLAQLNKLESVCELSDEGKLIIDYFNNSHAHQNIKITITNVYAVFREDYEQNFTRNNFLNEKRLLLWHGTKRANLKGIFDIGLKLPLGGGMFGQGIYFADRVTKSVGYSDGVLLLCEVAVGKPHKLKSAQTNLTSPPVGYQSVKGLGQNKPSSSRLYQKKNIKVPLGTTTSRNDTNCSLQYNEYIVYDPKRVLIKFFIEFQRN